MAGKHQVEAEISSQFISWPDGNEEGQFLLVGILGISDRIELSLEVPHIVHNPKGEPLARGVGDLQVIGKLALLRQRASFPGLALRGLVKANTGNSSDGLGSGGTDYQIVLAGSSRIAFIELHAMGGASFIEEDGGGGTETIFPYGLAGDWALTEGFHAVAEIVGHRHSDRPATEDLAVLSLGAIFPLTTRLTVDAAAGLGLTEAAPDVTAMVGMTVLF